MRPGPWLRLTAVVAASSTLLAVVSGAAGLGTAHRLLAALGLPPLCALVAAGRVAYPRLLPPAATALVAFLGAAAVIEPRALHVALAAVAFAASLVAAVAGFRGDPVPAGDWRDYVALTKPRIMSLLLVTGACGMIGGAGGWPGTASFAAAMTGLALACGGASALNHMLDADIDRLMGKRTERRPVAAGRVSPARALDFGLTLSALSFVLLASALNLLTALLALAGNLFYVIVYTRWLKRATPQNIVIGGAAGATPVLVGWAAGSGRVGLPALCLFAIVFFWTPPHFWALALVLREHYAAAKVPMLPVVRGERETSRQIVVYTVALLAASVLPFALGAFGSVYLVGAIALGAVFLAFAAQLARDVSRRRALLLFHYSLLYLALLFVVAAVDLSLAPSAAASPAVVRNCGTLSIGPGSTERGATVGARCLLRAYQQSCQPAVYMLSLFGVDTVAKDSFRVARANGRCVIGVTISFTVVPQPARLHHGVCRTLALKTRHVVAGRCTGASVPASIVLDPHV